MRLGLAIGYWGLGPPAAEQLDRGEEAERLGFHSAWTAEAYGSDAATVLAWLAAQTSTIGLGAAVFQIPGRSAAMTAMTAATLDRLSAGRFLLGLGTSGPQVSEGWHGRRFAHQLLRTREYVEVVRIALRREPVRYQGETLELPLPNGPGKALRLMIGPVQERIPIYLAALGPRNTALAAEIADGWLPTLVSPEHMDTFRPALEEGFARSADTTESQFDIAPLVSVCIDDDLEAARNAMRPQLALYIGGMGSREKNFYNRLACAYGFEGAASEIHALYLAGRTQEAEAALPDGLIDAVCIVGPRDRARDRLASYRAAGVGTLIVWPMGSTARTRRDQLRLVADLAS
jgi:F420-dependent oxidoreductase-like protein